METLREQLLKHMGEHEANEIIADVRNKLTPMKALAGEVDECGFKTDLMKTMVELTEANILLLTKYD